MVRAQAVSLKFVPNTRRQQYRLAVVVSRKVSKSAVVRNRIRRRLYETVRLLSTSFTGVFDLVLVVYDEKLADVPTQKMTIEINKLCKKAGIISDGQPVHAIVEAKE